MPNAGEKPTGRKQQTELDYKFLSLALQERLRSDDPNASETPRSAVGTVIARGEDVLGMSANVLPPALKALRESGNLEISFEERYFFIEHAERAAILKALLNGHSLSGATIYCTRFPCSDCARAIVWTGIKRAVFASGFGQERRWISAQRAALHILRSAGVVVRILKPSI